jgi:dihydrofolate reductase
MTPMKSIIVAIDKNNGIGAANDLLWLRDVPSDLAYFKRMTTGKTIIMGRNTFDGIGKPLPNRENIVVSHRPVGMPGVITAASLESAYAMARYPIFVIGGGRIYADALADMDRLYVTEINATFEQATVFFPAIDPTMWHEVSREKHDADERNAYDYTFVVYDRNN